MNFESFIAGRISSAALMIAQILMSKYAKLKAEESVPNFKGPQPKAVLHFYTSDTSSSSCEASNSFVFASAHRQKHASILNCLLRRLISSFP